MSLSTNAWKSEVIVNVSSFTASLSLELGRCNRVASIKGPMPEPELPS